MHNKTVQQLIDIHKLDPVALPLTITANNVRQIKKQLLTIYKLIYQKARLECRQMDQLQIQHNIKLRCFNYEEDLTKMIDSILNREK